MTHARLSIACALAYLCVIAVLFYFVRDFWRICMWGVIVHIVFVVGLGWNRRRWEAAFRFLSWTVPFLLVFVIELSFAGYHYARSLSDEWVYPKVDREADSVAKEFIRSNPRRRVLDIPVHEPIESEYFNINADGYRAPDFGAESDADLRFIVVGGSTVFGTDVADGNTLPSRLKAALKTRGLDVEVVNLGQEFLDHALELAAVKQFEAVLNPDLVIFYHGANDYYYSWENVMEPEPPGLVLEDTLRNRFMARLKDSFFLAYLGRLTATTEKEHAVAAKRDQLVETAVERYSSARRAAESYCRQERLACVFFLQPYITNKQPLSYSETVRRRRDLTGFPGFGELYDQVSDELLARFPNTGDLRDALDGIEETVYFDLVHVNGTGNAALAAAIAEALPTFPANPDISAR